jgi:integrase
MSNSKSIPRKKNRKNKKRDAYGLGCIFKRKNGKRYPADSNIQGVFYLQYTLNGKRQTPERLTYPDGKPIKNKEEAEKERDRRLMPLIKATKAEQLENLKSKIDATKEEQKKAFELANPPLSIADAWDAYLKSLERRTVSSDTQARYKGHWEQFKTWLSDNYSELTYLREIDTKIAREHLSEIKAKASPNTFNKHLGFLRSFFKVLKTPARIHEHPFEGIPREPLKTDSRRELAITELNDVLEKAEGDLKTLLYIGTFTALRLGDCCTLKWEEINLDKKLIRRVPNKTASKGVPAFIGIPPEFHEKLIEIPLGNRKGYVLPEIAKLYNSKNNAGLSIKQAAITRRIQKHFESCGIQIHREGTGYRRVPNPKKLGKYIMEFTGKRAVVEVGFHSLRHTYVSLHADKGTPLAVIQAIVGHSNPAMTRHYTHTGEEAAIKAAQAWSLSEPELPPSSGSFRILKNYNEI